MLKERLNMLEIAGIIPKNAIKTNPDLFLNAKSINNIILNEDDNSFNEIITILLNNGITFNENCSLFFYRLFTLDSTTLRQRIESFKSVDEMDYVKQNPHILATTSTSEDLVKQIVSAKSNQQKYRYVDEDGYINFEFGGSL